MAWGIRTMRGEGANRGPRPHARRVLLAMKEAANRGGLTYLEQCEQAVLSAMRSLLEGFDGVLERQHIGRLGAGWQRTGGVIFSW
jgi:hypothetical protein